MSTKLDRSEKKNNKSALLAISGGVDSIVLLNLLAAELSPNNSSPPTSQIEKLISNFIGDTGLNRLELAYTNHQQREDTDLDITTIQTLAKKFNLRLHVSRLDLPKDCSEQLARQERYKALNKIKEKLKLDHIITAHHADDVLETAIINLTRGTGLKGLASLHHQADGIWRPFLYKLEEGMYITKKDILNYAQEHNLNWHEDSTNKSDTYLRNRIRQKLIQKRSDEKLKLLKLISSSLKLNKRIYEETQVVELILELDNSQTYSTKLFKQLPEEVKDQFLHTKISQNGFDVSREAVQRAKEFVQTKTTGKVLQLKGCEIKIPKKDNFQFISLTEEKPI